MFIILILLFLFIGVVIVIAIAPNTKLIQWFLNKDYKNGDDHKRDKPT
jgi:hypothetical protein